MPTVRLFLLLAIATLLAALSAVVPAFGLLALGLDLSILVLFVADLARARGTPLDVSRRWPPMLVQGVPAEVEVTLHAPAGATVALRESLHPKLADRPHRADIALAPGVRTVWRYTVVPRRRGAAPAGPLTARIRGPWGLAWSQRQVLAPEACKIFPQVRWQGRVGRLLLLAHRRALGHNPQRLQGAGSEPYALRAYLPGDPLGKVHWKASARHGALISREDTWERGARLVILLDCARSMSGRDAGRAKLDHALAAALALARVAVARGDQVTMVAFSNQVERTVRLLGRRGGRGLAAAYEALYDLEARPVEPAYDLAAERAIAAESRRSTVVMLTSVTDLAAAALLQRALVTLERRHRPLLINLQDPEIVAVAEEAPSSSEGAFAKAAALDILRANRDLGRRLRHAGVRVVATPSDRLALSTLEAYLAYFAPGARRAVTKASA